MIQQILTLKLSYIQHLQDLRQDILLLEFRKLRQAQFFTLMGVNYDVQAIQNIA